MLKLFHPNPLILTKSDGNQGNFMQVCPNIFEQMSTQKEEISTGAERRDKYRLRKTEMNLVNVDQQESKLSPCTPISVCQTLPPDRTPMSIVTELNIPSNQGLFADRHLFPFFHHAMCSSFFIIDGCSYTYESYPCHFIWLLTFSGGKPWQEF